MKTDRLEQRNFGNGCTSSFFIRQNGRERSFRSPNDSTIYRTIFDSERSEHVVVDKLLHNLLLDRAYRSIRVARKAHSWASIAYLEFANRRVCGPVYRNRTVTAIGDWFPIKKLQIHFEYLIDTSKLPIKKTSPFFYQYCRDFNVRSQYDQHGAGKLKNSPKDCWTWSAHSNAA